MNLEFSKQVNQLESIVNQWEGKGICWGPCDPKHRSSADRQKAGHSYQLHLCRATKAPPPANTEERRGQQKVQWCWVRNCQEPPSDHEEKQALHFPPGTRGPSCTHHGLCFLKDGSILQLVSASQSPCPQIYGSLDNKNMELGELADMFTNAWPSVDWIYKWVSKLCKKQNYGGRELCTFKVFLVLTFALQIEAPLESRDWDISSFFIIIFSYSLWWGLRAVFLNFSSKQKY